MLPSISPQGFIRIAQSLNDKDANFWEGLRDLTIGRPDYGTWAGNLDQKLQELGEDIFSIDRQHLVTWFEEGFTEDQAVQLALQYN